MVDSTVETMTVEHLDVGEEISPSLATGVVRRSRLMNGADCLQTAYTASTWVVLAFLEPASRDYPRALARLTTKLTRPKPQVRRPHASPNAHPVPYHSSHARYP